MTKKELIESLAPFDDDDIVICKGEDGGWDNIQGLSQEGTTTVAIMFGGGSPFSDE
jgi:hypothetical protein